MQSERTPLRSGAPAPNYVFMTNPNRVYRTKIRQFQCCVCAAILTVFVAAVVMTVSYSVNHDTEDDNGTTPTLQPSEQMQTLLKKSWPLADLADSATPVWNSPVITAGELEAAIDAGQEGLKARDELETLSPSLALNSPSYKHTKAVGTSLKATELARSAFVMDVATQQLMAGRRTTTGGSVGRGPMLDADWLPEEVCRDTLDEFSSCPPTPYRSVDGTCNNLQHPLKWGVAMRPFRRTLPADYADGVSKPRVAVDGSPLPSAREVSVSVHRPLYQDDPDFTVMLAVWGQFMDHDITATALSQKSTGKSISCCNDGQWPYMKMHPECFPVPLGAGDPYYHAYNLTCMEFVRSAPAPTCSLGAREQLNQASNFLDGSVVYGTTPELMSSLRRYISGELRMMVTEDGRTLLPKSEDPNDGCNRAEMNAKGRYCFLSGDSRANENTHLTSMHLLWARQHNALAAGLAKVNPTWDDERLYQEARRIVSAQMEHITYNEFLPIVFGETLMEKLELTPKKTGYYEGYDETVDPTIANSFAASAFRFAHTLLPSLMKILANYTNSAEYVEMHKILFNPYVLYKPGYLDGSLKGLMNTDILKVDPHVSSELSQHLFESSPPKSGFNGPCGLDLVSLNIQRGRDHGLPSYPKWREHCGLSRPTSFADLKGIMDDDSIDRISTIYKSVEDIDMYTGMLSEVPLDGGIIGPTVTCVLADQFVRLKKGDRYWYETSQTPQAFTPEQLDEVRKTTLAKVLCDTSDSVGELQRLVMRSVTLKNPRVSCAELPKPDLSKWREVEGSYVQAGIGHVKIPSSKVHIAPPTSAGRLTATAGLGEPHLKTLAVGATVMGGRIFTAGGTAWSGQLPLAIPVPLFDTVDYSGTIDTKTVDPPVIGHGILWEGTLSTDSYGYANFEGRFSMPRYIHGNGIQKFSIKWLSGEFSFYTKLAWDSTRNIPITVSGKYSSPVYLQERPQYQYLKDPTIAPAPYSFNDVSRGFVPNPTIQNGPGVYRSPCILHGAYSTDRKTFLWTGNITLIIPNAVPYDTWANNWTLTNEIGVFKRSSWLTASKPGVPAATTKSSVGVGVTVTSGSLTASSNGSSPETWWSGQFPVAIPVPIFNRVLTSSTGSGSAVFGTGVSWSGSSIATGPLSSNITGSFSLPIYVHGPGTNFSIQWWEGNFSMQTQSLWNMSLNGAFLPGVTYTSPIYLQALKSDASIQTVLDTLDDIDDDPTLQLLTASGGSAGLAPKIPIILHGNYTPDKTQFYWMGNITFILPTAPSPFSSAFKIKSKYKSWVSSGSMQESGVTASKSLSLGMTVEGGQISSTAGNMWSGEIPVAIPVPLFDSVAVPDPTSLIGTDPPVYGHGIVWTGGITSDSSGYANMEGTFSLPKYVHGSGIDIQWLSGHFVFYTRLIWNSTGVVPPTLTGKYSSPIYLRATKQYEYLKDVVSPSVLGTLSIMNAGFVPNPAVVNDPSIKKAPIILHGTYSTDKTMFIWSGNATLVIPDVVPYSSLLLGSEKSYMMKPPVNMPTSSMAVGVSVTSGSITASSGDSSPVTWWSGAFPAALPVPLFNKVLSASAGSGTIVFGTGITWSGSAVSNGAAGSVLSGSFSLPIYTHGPGANFSIEWWTGKFSLQYNNLLNATLEGAVLPGVTYTSQIYFRQAKTADTLDVMIKDYVDAEKINDELAVNLLRTGAAAAGPKMPIILHGNYNPDKTQFYWFGNATIILPTMPPSPPLTQEQRIVRTLSYLSLSQSQKLSSSWMTSPTEPGAKPKATKSSTAVGVSVTSGSITASSGDSSPVTWWSGAFPAALPVPLFNKVISASAGSGTIVFGTGISWSGSAVSNGAAGSVLSGSFSLPIYTHGPGANFSIEWWTGNFSLQYNNLLNATLEGAVLPGVTYTSQIYFRQAKTADTLDVMIKDYVDAEKINDELAVNLLRTAAAATGPKMPIILHGNYTPDKTQFYWFGNVTIILPIMPPSPPLTQEQRIVKTLSYMSPSKSAGIPLVLGGTVTSGAISAEGGSIWSGELPVAIHLPLFDSIVNAGPVDMDDTEPPVFGHGILWDGTISTDYSGMASLEGTYSMPKFVHGSGPANFSIKWINGNFMFSSRLSWNSSLNMPISLGGKYSSPIYLRAIKEFEYLKYTASSSKSSSFYDISGAFISSPSVVNDPAVLKAPLILVGTYSVDKTMFIWSGNYSIIIPNAMPALSQSQKLSSSWMTSPTEPGAKPKATKSSTAVGVSVMSGSITASSGDSSPVTWWSGAFPAVLPVPLFNKVLSASAGSGTIVFGTGISWSGSAVSNGAAGSVLSGSFSLPIYTHGPGANFSIEWWTGNFSLQYNNLLNATLEGAVLPGVTYTSQIYFRQAKTADTLDVMIKDYVDAEKINDELAVNLLRTGAAAMGPKMPIILHGNYTPDKTQFYWFGNVTIILPIMPPSPPLTQELKIVKTLSYMSASTSAGIPLVLGGTVTSGAISAEGGSIWSGELPVAIHLPLFDSIVNAGPVDMDDTEPPVFGHGILWDGTISTDYSGMASLEGTYSMPKFVHGSGPANFSIKWINGNFMFSSRLSWNSSLNMPISLSGKYSSPIYLRAIKEFEYLKYTAASSKSSSFYDISGAFISSPSVVNDPAVLKAPLILVGTYSVDKTMFIWSGNYSIIIPNAMPALSQSQKLSSSWMTSPTEPGAKPKATKSSTAVGVSVMSGSITASSGDSSPVTWWSGAFPAALPVPLFNKVLSASAGSGTIVFGTGISWSGSAVSNGAAGSVLSGSFSLPIYTHGPGANFSIEWWTGNFSLQYNNLLNATLEGAVLPGVTYTSQIYFRQAKSADTLDVMIKDYVDAEKINDELAVNLLRTGASASGPKMPIILHGNYTPDKTQFYWFGNVTFILPIIPPSPPVMAGNVRLTSSPISTFIPTKPIRRPLALGATVMGGRISTTGGSAWSGELPVAIPVPLFDTVATPEEIDTEATDPPIYGHGILWDGTVSTDSSGYANFEGKFSMPRYVHGNGIANFTMKWLSGSFVFYTRLLWNSTTNVPISVTGTYSSPVYLQEQSQYEYLKDPSYASISSFSDVSSGFNPQPSISNGPGVFRSPCILHGIYSDDRTAFLWSGNFTLIVPNAIPINLWPGALYSPKPTSKSWLQSQFSSGDLTDKTKTSMPIGLNITSGKITASMDGSIPTTWWDGTLPTALPVPLFNKVVTASKASAPIIFGTGVSWTGMATTNTAGVSMLEGNFSLPVYVRGPGAMFSIQWWNGNFSLQVNTLLNKTLDAVLQPGITYSSPIYLRAGPMVNSLDTDVREIDSISSNPTLQFITSAKGAMGAEPKAPIILYGTYSPDKTQFWWSGNATLMVPSPTPSPITLIKLQKKMKTSVTSPSSSASGKVTLGAVVSSGSVVASSDSSSPSMWWNGEFPVAIPSNSFESTTNLMTAPPAFSHGVSWQGSLTKTALNEILLQGTFSMPRFIHGGGLKNFSIEWYRGQFSFQMSLLWNSTVDGLVSPGDTFSSPIYLQPVGMKNKSDLSFLNWDQPSPQIDSENLVHFISKSEEIISGATQVPVVLEGTYSPDFSIFWWTGSVILSFPQNPQPLAELFARIPFQQASSDVKPGKNPKPFKPVKPPKVSTTVGVSVVSGSIKAGLDENDPSVWWDGQIPLSFPLPAKDSLTVVAATPALSQNITWTGTLVSDSKGGAIWEGKFSLPSFNTSTGIYTNSTSLWTGQFSFKLSFLWPTTVVGLVKPGVSYTSHVKLINSVPKKKSTLVTDIMDSNDVQPEPSPSPTTERPSEPSPGVGPSTEPPVPKSNMNVPIMLRGYLSPDQTTFTWTGSAIISFPTAP